MTQAVTIRDKFGNVLGSLPATIIADVFAVHYGFGSILDDKKPGWYVTHTLTGCTVIGPEVEPFERFEQAAAYADALSRGGLFWFFTRVDEFYHYNEKTTADAVRDAALLAAMMV